MIELRYARLEAVLDTMTHSNAEPDLEQQSRYSPVLDKFLVVLFHRKQVIKKRTHWSQKVISRKTRLRDFYEERTVIGNGGANARKSKVLILRLTKDAMLALIFMRMGMHQLFYCKNLCVSCTYMSTVITIIWHNVFYKVRININQMLFF